ncbi:hypothetical protein D9M68_787630 [compost metagenome]
MAITRSLAVIRDIWRAACDTPPGPARDSTECRCMHRPRCSSPARKPLAPKPIMKTRSAARMASTACSQAAASSDCRLRCALRMSSSSVAAKICTALAEWASSVRSFSTGSSAASKPRASSARNCG